MDISMCFGNNCPIKESCKRYAGKTVDIYQWYSDFKGSVINGKYSCESFMELHNYNNQNLKNKKK